jgi:hypothetical protein
VKALMLSAVCLLALATSASAEGAWLLWEGNTQGELDAMTYKLLTTYPSARECIKAIDARVRAEQKIDSKLNTKAILKRTASTELWVETPAGTRVYKCLPAPRHRADLHFSHDHRCATSAA